MFPENFRSLALEIKEKIVLSEFLNFQETRKNLQSIRLYPKFLQTLQYL